MNKGFLFFLSFTQECHIRVFHHSELSSSKGSFGTSVTGSGSRYLKRSMTSLGRQRLFGPRLKCSL